MKILVTGKNGQVGSALMKAAEANPDIRIFGYDRSELDISNSDHIQHRLIQTEPDVVINAAAYTAVDRAEEDVETAFVINRDGPELLALCCAQKDIPFLHISTDFVFDGQKEGAYLETDSCQPISIYGRSKLAGENQIKLAWKKHLILRTAWVFGGQNNFVKTMQKLGAERPEISVVNDQFGGPTSATDIAAALLVMAQKAIEAGFNEWGVYHYTGTPSVSWYEFACEILKDNRELVIHPIPTTEYPTPARRPSNSVLNCQKIRSVFGIEQPDWKTNL
ncbi:dTDP-4-dehydrorhamnose reductase [Sneathiella aquimaris]|uniref:dTDP-4-dehydrorhamnose reductase n=1 Tax=Sneathiella aquimaris TaxID=2599305 RepID=UPI00146F40DF|nr:dTDP-4-dehydrorhamnose reductase [Sneathiella aquimaris]